MEDVTFMIGLDVLSYSTDSGSTEAAQITVLLVIVTSTTGLVSTSRALFKKWLENVVHFCPSAIP